MICREYQGPVSSGGHGRHAGKGLHVWIVEQIEGPLAPGEVVRHKCDNPPCFLYDHLERGTFSDNNRDTVARGHNVNANKQTCPAGHPYDRMWAGRRQCSQCRATYMDTYVRPGRR